MSELLILSRAVHFGSCLVLLGVFAVRLLIERTGAEDGCARRLAGLCLAGAAESGFLWFWVAAAGMSGSSLREAFDPRLFQVVLERTPPGQVWIARGVAGGLIGALLCLPRYWKWGALPAAGLVGSLAWLGHAGAAEDGCRWLRLAVDMAHLLAAGVWPAGLLPFALLLGRLTKAGALTVAHAATARFSALSLGTVSVLAATGLANACFLAGNFHALVFTDYGRLLVAKVGLFGIAVGFGARNLLVHKPRLEIHPGALAAIARNVWIEFALGTAIVLMVAVLGTLPPASAP